MSEHRPNLQWSPGAAGPVLQPVSPHLSHFPGPDAQDWRDSAACGAQPHLFFGPDEETDAQRRGRERKAKAVCAACPVRVQCWDLFRAIGTEHGVWAGVGERDCRRSYAASRPHKSSGERARLEAIREAGERLCSGPCGQVKPLDQFPSHGGTCKPCLGDRMREMNRRRREAQETAEVAA